MRASSLVPVVLLLTTACETGPNIVEATCPPDGERLVVSACVVPEGSTPSVVDLSLIADVDLIAATVIATGAGAPPEGCVDFHAWKGGQDKPGGEIAWMTVAGPDDARWTVSFAAGAPLPDLSRYAAVDVRFTQADDSPFAGAYGEKTFELVDADTGALIAWLADGIALVAMALPDGVSAARGDEACREEVECGTWVSYRADVTVDGETATLVAGGTTALGDLMVTFAGDDALEDLSCSETSGGSAGLALVAR